jgi:5-methylcytosine-specific restriction endonuclease McrA
VHPLTGRKQTKSHIEKRMEKAKKTWIKKGQHLSPETQFKKGQPCANKGLTRLRGGQAHYNWKGGISWITVSSEIKKRDNFTCQICGLRDEEIIEVDHIKPKSICPELKHDISNLMCLCPNCHRRKTKRDRKDIVNCKSMNVGG